MLAAIGPGPVERDEGGDVVEAWSGASDRMQRAHRAASSWNTPIESPALQQLEGRRVVERDGVDVEVDAAWCRGSCSTVSVMTSRLRRPEEVHLQQAEVFDAVHLVLRDDRGRRRVLPGLGLALDRAGTR